MGILGLMQEENKKLLLSTKHPVAKICDFELKIDYLKVLSVTFNDKNIKNNIDYLKSIFNAFNIDYNNEFGNYAESTIDSKFIKSINKKYHKILLLDILVITNGESNSIVKLINIDESKYFIDFISALINDRAIASLISKLKVSEESIEYVTDYFGANLDIDFKIEHFKDILEKMLNVFKNARLNYDETERLIDDVIYVKDYRRRFLSDNIPSYKKSYESKDNEYAMSIIQLEYEKLSDHYIETIESIIKNIKDNTHNILNKIETNKLNAVINCIKTMNNLFIDKNSSLKKFSKNNLFSINLVDLHKCAYKNKSTYPMTSMDFRHKKSFFGQDDIYFKHSIKNMQDYKSEGREGIDNVLKYATNKVLLQINSKLDETFLEISQLIIENEKILQG